MNKNILNTDIQAFINANLNSDLAAILLRGINFEGVNPREIIEQIEAKKRCKKKLPTWFNTLNIYYPNKLNIEQTSSEKTAEYKTSLVRGKSLVDLTGGFGVDCFYFSKQVKNVTHCEINSQLSQIAEHNFKQLESNNINCIPKSGIDYLKDLDQPFDYIYLDPSRRDMTKKKVFLLSDCEPNVKTFQGLFLKYAKNVMIKTSPLLDISATVALLKHVKTIHVVALSNEVKELLWILERDFHGDIEIKTVNLQKHQQQEFQFSLSAEPTSNTTYSEPLSYLYEPNAAILKAGAFNSVCNLGVAKLHKHSHLYTSKKIIDFPGRRFKIENILPYNKKAFAKTGISKANVTTRNFPISVGDIRKKLKIKDGGEVYLFFTTDCNNSKIIISCKKL